MHIIKKTANGSAKYLSGNGHWIKFRTSAGPMTWEAACAKCAALASRGKDGVQYDVEPA